MNRNLIGRWLGTGLIAAGTAFMPVNGQTVEAAKKGDLSDKSAAYFNSRWVICTPTWAPRTTIAPSI